MAVLMRRDSLLIIFIGCFIPATELWKMKAHKDFGEDYVSLLWVLSFAPSFMTDAGLYAICGMLVLLGVDLYFYIKPKADGKTIVDEKARQRSVVISSVVFIGLMTLNLLIPVRGFGIYTLEEYRVLWILKVAVSVLSTSLSYLIFRKWYLKGHRFLSVLVALTLISFVLFVCFIQPGQIS